MVHFGRGTRLNPIDTKRFILDSGLAYACMMLARYDEAAGWARKSLASAPHWAFASIPLAGALAMLGRREEAQVVVGQLLAQNPATRRAADHSLAKPRDFESGEFRMVQHGDEHGWHSGKHVAAFVLLCVQYRNVSNPSPG
jgi:hypothetical protein